MLVLESASPPIQLTLILQFVATRRVSLLPNNKAQSTSLQHLRRHEARITDVLDTDRQLLAARDELDANRVDTAIAVIFS
jgi:hypothetical protein